MIVTIAPSVEWKMGQNANQFPDNFIEIDRAKIREVSHIVKLNKESDHIEHMNSPT